jgi:hypothetical protein
MGFLVSLAYFLVRSFRQRRRKAARDLVSAVTADDEMEVAA